MHLDHEDSNFTADNIRQKEEEVGKTRLNIRDKEE